MLEELISKYGQLGIFIGSAVEGETAAFLGGVAAHRQIISFPAASFAASFGSFLADEALFFAGRHASHLSLIERLAKSHMAQRVTKLLEAHPIGFIFCARFLYGMRTVSPVIIGMSRIPTLQFVLLNIVSAAFWGAVMTGMGYWFGNLVETFLGQPALHVHFALGLAVVLVAAAVLAITFRRVPS